MKEYYIRTADEKHIDIIKAESKEQAISIFREKHHLNRYKNFIVFPSEWIFT